MMMRMRDQDLDCCAAMPGATAVTAIVCTHQARYFGDLAQVKQAETLLE